jgi:hypothetical protein
MICPPPRRIGSGANVISVILNLVLRMAVVKMRMSAEFQKKKKKKFEIVKIELDYQMYQNKKSVWML